MKQIHTALAVVAIVALAAIASPGIVHAQSVASPPTIHPECVVHSRPINSVKVANGVVRSMWDANLDFWSQGTTRVMVVVVAPVVYPVALVAGLFAKPACVQRDTVALFKPQRLDFLDRDAIKPALYWRYTRRRDFNRTT